MDYINIAVRYIGEAEVDDATIQGVLYYSIEETSENKPHRKEKHVYLGKRLLCNSAGILTVTRIVFIHLLLDKDAILLTCNFGLACSHGLV